MQQSQESIVRANRKGATKMRKMTVLDKIREWIGGIAFRVFLWSAQMTKDEYLEQVEKEARVYDVRADGEQKQ